MCQPVVCPFTVPAAKPVVICSKQSGSSQASIQKYMAANHSDVDSSTRTLRLALKVAVQEGKLRLVRGTYKLPLTEIAAGELASQSNSVCSQEVVEAPKPQSSVSSTGMPARSDYPDGKEATSAIPVYDSEEERAATADLISLVKDAITSIVKAAEVSNVRARGCRVCRQVVCPGRQRNQATCPVVLDHEHVHAFMLRRMTRNQLQRTSWIIWFSVSKLMMSRCLRFTSCCETARTPAGWSLRMTECTS